MITDKQKQLILKFQTGEMTSHLLYKQLAGMIKDKNNADVIREMSDTELRHYQFWRNVSQVDTPVERVKILFLLLMTRLLGLTFSIKLIEQAEAAGSKEYAEFESVIPGAAQMGKDEEGHETAMAAMIQEEFLSYIGSIVLGLNDALVELTGTLAGLTFALQSSQLVVVSGLITGIAAAISMAASEYLSARADNVAKAGLSALYTGLAYIFTVILLILPYLLVPQIGNGIFISLAITLVIAVLIILGFNFYVSVAKDLPFKQRFLEMLGISMGVSVLSFIVGLVVRKVFGINV